VSEYNGRQGLSWIGGWGLEVTDSKFNHTGRAINEGGGQEDGLPLLSAPGAGLDIEPNANTDEESRDGLFVRTEFINNAGAGMLADVGDGGYSTFIDCTFWATTHYSIWPKRPGLRFIDSRIYGTAVHPNDGHTDQDPGPNPDLATYFENCVFEDLEWDDGKVRREGTLFNMGSEGEGVTFKDCTFRNHETRAISAGDVATQEIFEGCTFELQNADLASGTHQASFSGSELRSVHFTESDAIANGNASYSIQVTDVTVADTPEPTVVDGPNVHWDTVNGQTGDIDPGTY
jgi:hypothetical protein